jgi:hypothetical protein
MDWLRPAPLTDLASAIRVLGVDQAVLEQRQSEFTAGGTRISAMRASLLPAVHLGQP